MLPNYLRRMVRRGNYRRHFWQRLGRYSTEDRARLSALPSPVWVQAVSVGEMLVALKLIAAMRTRRPGLALVLSTTTTTGFQLARERAPEGVQVIYTPIDLRFAVRKAFDLLRPGEVVIVDGGLWPNQLLEARRQNVTVTLANARLSPRSERRFRRFRFFAESMFGLLDRVCVTEAGDIERWQSLGVARDRITNTGSIKFDDAPPVHDSAEAMARAQAKGAHDTPQASLRRLHVRDDAPVLLGGSTHPGEEILLAKVFLGLRISFPDLLLIIAPRHVERAREILADLQPLNLRIVARSSMEAEQASFPLPPDVFLLDTTGELNAWYTAGTVVFIGKSLAAAGGQNPAEPIAAGRPVLFGPHMENFESLVAQLLAAQATIQIQNTAELQEKAAFLLADGDERRQMAERARQLLLTHQGAARRTAELLLP